VPHLAEDNVVGDGIGRLILKNMEPCIEVLLSHDRLDRDGTILQAKLTLGDPPLERDATRARHRQR
jgi:hypothetical protein